MSLRTDIHGKRVQLLGACGVLSHRYAEILTEQNATLAIADQPGSGVMDLASTLGAYGCEIDVTNEPGLDCGVEHAEAALGGLDGAIFNAAMTIEGLAKQTSNPFPTFEDYPTDLWRYTLSPGTSFKLMTDIRNCLNCLS